MATSAYREDQTLCNGATEPTFSSHSCAVQVSSLISLFGYQRGQILLVKARAYNQRGYGPFSNPNTQGAVVKTVPTFMNDPQANSFTSSSFTVFYEGIAIDLYTGASPISSYNL